MIHIHSTYTEWSPHYDDHPDGRAWGAYADYAAAWAAVRAYLLADGWATAPGDGPEGLAPFGHTLPTARYGDTTIVNDAETITITE